MPETQPMTDIQMAEIQAEPMILATLELPVTKATPKPKELKDYPVQDYVKPSLIRYANYDYKNGTTFFLSKTEQIIVDAYLKTNNESEATRVVNQIYAAHGSARRFHLTTIHRWLRKPHIARYIADKLLDDGKVNWFDQKKWEAWGIDAMVSGTSQKTQTQVAIWKEFGKARGWYVAENPTIMNNTQINFTQSTGQA